MDIKTLCEKINSKSRVAALSRIADDKIGDVALCGLAGSSVAVTLASIPLPDKRKMIVIANDDDDAGYIYFDLCQILGESNVLIFPSGYKRDIKYGQVDAPAAILRTEVLNNWTQDNGARIVVTYPEALAEKVESRACVEESTMRLAVDENVMRNDVISTLRKFGFVETDYVYEPGQFAVRGSIIDIYSFTNELPYRIDFFGDDIDSIRIFNVESQLSEEKVNEVYILNNAGASGKSAGISLLDFVEDNPLIAVRDADWTLQRIEAIGKETVSEKTLIANEGDRNAMDNVVDYDRFRARFASFRKITFTAGQDSRKADAVVKYNFAPQGIYHKNFDLISESFGDFLKKGYEIFILSESEKQIERLREIFRDRGDNIPFTAVEKTLHEGFVDNESRLCVFTDHQIFDRFHKYSLKSDRARSGKLALSLKELNQIEVGDYIVHIDHGVGRFGGLMRTNVNGRLQEMIKLTFQGDDIVFVSIHALHKLSKYRGKEGEKPRLNKLGSNAWHKLKANTKNKLKDIARDLIKLYAARREEKGFAFSPDGFLQQELEASFIYEDTPDQLKATNEVKADMESPRPMDRLICGDVGFGKTEVAIRAAFKAATDNKQTAVLVPTTVLAYQHYNTFRDRLKDFPVRIDYLSRARSPKDVKAILADLAEGKIDIIIGTHKLIGKNVKFKDLGLLVVDEEQKFGVAVKEKLKQLKVNVDTLTMSATPIPRTLQFSLMGARDLSAITTPPANRYPIMTSVTSLSDDIVSEAINFELSRNGQVFFISNRIEQLYGLRDMIARVVPDARVVVGHGQMPPEQLEQSIIDFANHDYDVLLATTIIESGIDMPNVNTIIINNAQNFGLSELHQLRGRVGRSNRKAFCYMLVPPNIPLTPVAKRRLQAIESFSELGSGIHIAMQDLDIRGAGNLLGAEQSGFIADLGYETYQKILREAVLELRTEEFADEFAEENKEKDAAYVAECTVETDMEIYFPAMYVPQEGERISLYQELDNMERETDVLAFKKRLEDRFGKIPREGLELIRIVSLRRLGKSLGIEKIVFKEKKMYLYFVGSDNLAYYQSDTFGKILNFATRNIKRCQLREVRERRSILVSEVPSIEEGVAILTEISATPA